MNLRYLINNIGQQFAFDPRPISFTWSNVGELVATEFNRWRLDGWDRNREILFFSHDLGYVPQAFSLY